MLYLIIRNKETLEHYHQSLSVYTFKHVTDVLRSFVLQLLRMGHGRNHGRICSSLFLQQVWSWKAYHGKNKMRSASDELPELPSSL
jgi:hypothetical protein